MTTVISHFYNEEYLLPWWLMHHTQIFDHGILINRSSTDRSLEICKHFAPHWEVRNSRVPEFDAIEVDREVMDIEKECTGWKMVLNTTEFLCCQNKDEFFSSLTALGEHMYSIRVIMLVDDPNHSYPEAVYNIPLVNQRYHGYFPIDNTHPNIGRLIHKHEHGAYTAGRHWSPHKFIVYLTAPAFVIKFFYSPWNDLTRKRKLQIGPTLSAHSIQHGLGIYHVTTPEKLQETYLFYASGTKDLRLNPEYLELFPHLKP
nr:glycosyltransferase family 2 protein [Brevibacillus laterosporus]